MTETTGFRAFFENLATNEEFRAAVIEDPCSVLDTYEIEYDPERIPETITLPSAAELSEKLELYPNEMGEDPDSFIVWMFWIK